MFLFSQVFKNIFDLLEENGQFFSIFVASNPYHQIIRRISQQAEQYIAPYYDSKVSIIYSLLEHFLRGSGRGFTHHLGLDFAAPCAISEDFSDDAMDVK